MIDHPAYCAATSRWMKSTSSFRSGGLMRVAKSSRHAADAVVDRRALAGGEDRALRPAFTALTACLVLALAACGGDDDAGDTDNAAFISQVNAICAEYRPKLEFLQPPASFWTNGGGGPRHGRSPRGLGERAAVARPARMADEYDEWLGLRAEMTTAMRDVQTPGTLHDEPAIAAGLERVGRRARRG
jgi:hypothetical protein